MTKIDFRALVPYCDGCQGMDQAMKRKPRVKTSWLIASFLLIYLAQQFAVVLVTTERPESYAHESSDANNFNDGDTLLPPIDLEVERQKSLQYVKSIASTKRDLVFLHIPKAAGTTVEQVGGVRSKPKMSWGSCRFNHRPSRRGNVCAYPPGQFEWPTKIGYWHLPPQLFPLMGVNPYESADIFAVVREPVDRLLSEFYYICKRKRTKDADRTDCDPSRMHDKTYLNEWMQRKAHSINHNWTTAESYFQENGHYTPQFNFLVANFDIRMVDYVIPMKDLKKHFDPLMVAYDIQAVMLPDKRNAARNTTDLGVQDLNAATLELIHQRFQGDFDILFVGMT